ncbi:MAG: hypothetical protein QNM02_21580 [Acidimicrobiia bacterium]|nr:hypothetical protein [Acidimicrobiia bacterium]
MKNAVATPPIAGAADRARGEQLTLLPTHDVPARFRLAEDTRRRGLRHIAEIRQTLAEREAAAAQTNVHRLPRRTPRAA